MVDPVRINEIGEIVCDTEGCGYRLSSPVSDREQFIDKPCPKCGANLLTRESFEAGNALIAVAKWINTLLGDVPDSGEPLKLRIGTPDGIPTIKEIL